MRIRPADRYLAARRASLLLLLLTAGSTSLHAQLTPEQVTRLQAVTSAALSPDARHVAYTLSQPRAPEEDTVAGLRGFSELWVTPASGGEPRPIVQRPASASSPMWSPDGSVLAFTLRGQVHTVPVAGGEPRAVTDVPGGVLAFKWSPDGRSIAYTSRVAEDAEAADRRRRGDDVMVSSDPYIHWIVGAQPPRPVRVWVRPADGGDAVALTPETEFVRDFVWSPDSRTLAVQLTETGDADADQMYRRLVVVSTDGRSPLTIPTEGKLGPMAWSRDGSRLAFLGATSFNDPLAQSVFVVTPGGAPVNLIPGFEGSAVWVDWQDDRTVRFIAGESTKTALNTVPAAGGAVTRVVGHGPEIFTSANFARDGTTFAVAANTALHPNEVYIGSTRDRRLRRVTNHNGWLAGVQLGRQETVDWTARDGWTMQGVLIHPAGAPEQHARAPLAVLPHGGPEGTSYDGWSTNALYPAQVLAGAGYAVFMPNYRASGGRGVAFSKGDHRDLGGREFDDVLDGISHLHAIAAVDSARVGISGTSYGGYFSAWAGTRHSERFRLAMPFAGISNWMSFTGTTDIPVEMAVVHWDLWPYEHPLLMWERSPLAHTAQARTPMIIGHGLADDRVHPEQMIQLHQALRLKGVPTELILYPREPHGLLERQHQLDYMRRILRAFDMYVKPAVRPAT
ncbi:MAG: S9 family peptidase [Gemmatimonadetes bacterium]|nr:S9 family peptidase [Gemmatimonadota bacterium]